MTSVSNYTIVMKQVCY